MSSILRSTDINAALRSRRAQPRRHNAQRGFLLNPFRFAAPAGYTTALLLRANGANGSTPVDESPSARTPTGSTTCVQSGSAKFGAAGMNFPGVGSNYLDYSVSSGSDLDLSGTGDFTIQCWVKPLSNAWGEQQCLFGAGKSPYAATDLGVEFRFYATGASGGLRAYSGGTVYDTGNSAGHSIGTWYHLAGVRQGSMLRFYSDGVQTGSVSIGSAAINSVVGGVVRIGSRPASVIAWPLLSDVDDYQVIKGLCLYPNGTTFTPPGAL